jgi:integrase
MAKIKFTDRTVSALKSGSARVDYWDDCLPGFGLRVTPDGDKTFCVKYRIAGKQRWFSLGRFSKISLATARDMARDAFELVRKGTDPAIAKREAEKAVLEQERKLSEEARQRQEREDNTFKRLSHDFLEQHSRPNKRSWKTDEWYIKKILNPELGERPAEEIKRREVRELLDRIKAEGKPIMAATFRLRLLTAQRGAEVHAMRWKDIDG